MNIAFFQRSVTGILLDYAPTTILDEEAVVELHRHLEKQGLELRDVNVEVVYFIRTRETDGTS